MSQNGPWAVKVDRRLLPRLRGAGPRTRPGPAREKQNQSHDHPEAMRLSSASGMPPTFMPSRPAKRVDRQREHGHHGQDEQTAAVGFGHPGRRLSCSNLMRSCSAPMSRSTTAKSSLDCTKRCVSSPDSQSGGLAMTRLSAPGSGGEQSAAGAPRVGAAWRARPSGARRGWRAARPRCRPPSRRRPARDALQLVGLVAQQMVEAAPSASRPPRRLSPRALSTRAASGAALIMARARMSTHSVATSPASRRSRT